MGANVRRAFCGVVAISLIPSTTVLAQTPGGQNQNPPNPAISALKGRIAEAEDVQKTFANGLKFCSDLDGKSFYFEMRNRVFNLDDYHRSLTNLAKDQIYNPATQRPWSEKDATERWEQARKEAVRDQANCALVASLPQLHKQLDELQKNSDPSK